MKRIFAMLTIAGLLTVPAVASAEPQFVYVRYGNGQPYLYVTTEPRPYHPLPLALHPRPWLDPVSGVYFDSDVGAACGTLHTEVYFSPSGTSLDAADRTTLGTIGDCLARGALSGRRVNIIASYDGSVASLQRSHTRLAEVISHLYKIGVRSDQLTYTNERAPGWQADRVKFRLAVPVVWQ